MKTLQKLKQSKTSFEAELAQRRTQFSSAIRQGLVRGSFSGRTWIYKGRPFHFHFFEANPSKGASSTPGFASNLARCVLIKLILRGISDDRMCGYHMALRILTDEFGDDLQAWALQPTTRLNSRLKVLKTRLNNRSVYLRACDMNLVLREIAKIQHRAKGINCRFSLRTSPWRHGLPNPIAQVLDDTSPAHTQHSKEKFRPHLEAAIGKARFQILQNPSLEPKEGYDRVRLEGLGFCLALGLRNRELNTLPRDAIDHDDRSGAAFARAYTAKGATPAARPIPDIWEKPLLEAHNYLLTTCAAARSRAKEIETNGLSFVHRTLKQHRELNPLTEIQRMQFFISGLDPNEHYFREEIAACFDVSIRQFDSRSKKCVAYLVKECNASIITFVDQRFDQWHWDHVWRPPPARGGSLPYSAFLDPLGRKSHSHRGFRACFKGLLSELEAAFLKAGSPSMVNRTERDRLRADWIEIRGKFLKAESRTKSIVVSISAWASMLESKYRRYLERHWHEIVSDLATDAKGKRTQKRIKSKNSRSVKAPPLSEHLIVVWEDQFDAGSPHLGLLPRPLFLSDFAKYVGKSNIRNIFERLNILDENGKPVSLSPHMIRHWLTDTLIRSGPSEMIVDLWMGRQPGAARHYDHRTAKERAEIARARYFQSVVPDDYLGRRVIRWREDGLDEVFIRRLVTIRMAIMHFVPWGGCSRELAVMPCDRGLMCLRGFGTEGVCKSFHIDPSDEQARQAIIDLRAKNLMLLRTIEPEESELRRLLEAEFNHAEMLDQHLKFIVDVIKGCDAALLAYERGAAAQHKGIVRVNDFLLVNDEDAA